MEHSTVLISPASPATWGWGGAASLHPISPLTPREDRGKAKGPKRDEMDSPRMTTIRNLAAALDVEPVDLLDDE